MSWRGGSGVALKGAAEGSGVGHYLPAAFLVSAELLSRYRFMTSADRNDLGPAQEKLEWVTPKISLMGAEYTDGKLKPTVPIESVYYTPIFGWKQRSSGPS